jgi:HK97 gp10 family phage protein
MSGGRGSFSMRVDTSGLKQYLDQLGQAAEEAARPAAQAMAQVYYDAARSFAPVSKKAHYFYGTSFKETGVRYGPFAPGNLRDSIYQVFSKSNSGKGLATYHVSYNYKNAPYAAMVEFGTSNAAPHPFIRRAMFAQWVRAAAYDAGEKVLREKLAAAS